jgi:hypothetical protein
VCHHKSVRFFLEAWSHYSTFPSLKFAKKRNVRFEVNGPTTYSDASRYHAKLSPTSFKTSVLGDVRTPFSSQRPLLSLRSVSCRAPGPGAVTEQRTAPLVDDPIARAFASRASDVQVQGEGKVIRVLADDLDGSRHQRFIVELVSGQTLLISLNVDIAPRIDGPR